ncbi:MAG TPA: glycosyltransferase family 2 protein [bacterium]|nr:glycosyltransferase family 2 protein [bacterium]
MDLSVVIPVFNERENIIPLCEGLVTVLAGLGCSFEVIFVDDGSTDGTEAVLGEAVERWNGIRAIRFRRNFGQSPALQAGFDHAQGKVIVTMDGDLQNDPTDIPRLLERLEEGYDIVSGFRSQRKEGVIRRLPSAIANWLLRKATGVPLHDTGCTLKAYRKEVIESVRLYGEQHRFIPVLASQFGAKITEIPVKHWQRRAGKSKYGLSRTHRVFLDILMLKFLLSYGTRPLQVFGVFGLGSFLLGIVINIYLTIKKIQGHPLAERPLLLLGILLVILGVQFVSMGLLAEMLVRTYHETSRRPTYWVERILRSKHEDA